MQGGNASGTQRKLLPLLRTRRQHDRMPAQVECKRESASVACGCRQCGKAAGGRLKGHVPAVIGPRRVPDPDLAEHLRSEVDDRESLMVSRRVELVPVAHLR